LVRGSNPNRRATGRQNADRGNPGTAQAAGGVMGNPAEIIQFQKKQEAKFICSACGADRACDCNAPAVEKLAEIKEQARQRDRAYKERKRQQKQQSGDVAAREPERAKGAEVSIEQRRAEYAALDAESTAVLSVEDDLEDATPDQYRRAFLLRALDAIGFAVYSGEVDEEVIIAAERVVMHWRDFTQTLKARYGNKHQQTVQLSAPDIPDDLSIPPPLRRSAYE
jgi:hypothetical protein